jgi:hypothetical protein
MNTMIHVTTFEAFVNEGAFHAALAKAKEQGLKEFEFQGKKYPVKEDALKEGEDLNEAAKDKYYEIGYWEEHAKNIYDYKTKMYILAKKAIDELPTILEDCCPGKFDLETIGFSEKGNAFFMFANLLDPKDRLGFDYGALEDNADFKSFFDMAGGNLDSASQRMYTSSFRLDDTKA